MGWAITHDHINKDELENATGIYDGNFGAGINIRKFRLYDDDDILYYEGIADGDYPVEQAFDYFQADSGVTRCDIHHGAYWEVFLG